MPKDAFAQLLKEMDRHMLETIDAAKREFAMIRTGRANPAILDRVLVEYYGEKVPIKQVGTISAPEPRLLMISPWDKQMIKPIVGAITSSELGLNPNTDGNVIRVPLPQLTTERRKELARMVGRKTEDGKVGLRNIRRDIDANVHPSIVHFGRICVVERVGAPAPIQISIRIRAVSRDTLAVNTRLSPRTDDARARRIDALSRAWITPTTVCAFLPQA